MRRDEPNNDPYAARAAERSARGKEARRRVPRSSHAEWRPASGRDPFEILATQDESRVPELVPIRYGRMSQSAFAFYRGGAAIMAYDLDGTTSTGLEVQLCGDAHLMNFGVFAAPDRSLVFDCNDFDETTPGPFEWDVRRLAASVAVAGRDRGLNERERRKASVAAVGSYREAMRRFAEMRDIDVWYARIDVEPTLAALGKHMDPQRQQQVDRRMAKAKAKDSVRAARKLTEASSNGLRIASDPPLIVPIEDLANGAEVEQQVASILEDYKRSLASDRRHLATAYRYVHAARKVVGVGSVGTRAWIILLVGRDSDDPLFLQAKEAQQSVLEPYVGASRFDHHGRRVVEGQRLMQATGDVLLGWITAKGSDSVSRDFYVRQLWDGKGSANIEQLSATELAIYAGLCGKALARAHARSGDRFAIASYLGRGKTFDQAVADFAETYADQNERDFAELERAIAGDRIGAVADL